MQNQERLLGKIFTEGSNETKEQTKTAFENLLKDALQLESDAIEIMDVHRLPQYPIKKQSNYFVRPIIAKVLTTFGKDLIFKNISKLKEYNENWGSQIYVTDHLPQLFPNKRNTLCLSLKKLSAEEKKLYNGVFMILSIH